MFFYNIIAQLLIIIMRLLWISLAVPSFGLFNFNDLLGRIHQATLKFEQQADDVKNREEDELRNIEMRERDVDRALAADAEKFHWKQDPQSLLERKRYKKLRVKPKPIAADEDIHILEETEKQRELAEKNFLEVEKEIAELPDNLLGTSERRKKNLDVPLDEDYDDSNEEEQ